MATEDSGSEGGEVTFVNGQAVEQTTEGESHEGTERGDEREAAKAAVKKALEEDAKEEEAAPKDEGQAEAQAEQKPLTAEDVRAAMHATRQRIEGEDYKENTNGDLYKKYHKPLTAQFKNIAALLGAEKPSALPPDKIANFIEHCNGLQVMEDGTIGSNCPF